LMSMPDLGGKTLTPLIRDQGMQATNL